MKRRSFLLSLTDLLKRKNKPCQIISGLTFKSIPANYSTAIIVSPGGVLVEREARTKIWHVAVTTAEPEMQCRSHAAWMLNLMLERSFTVALIAELERLEIIINANQYSKGRINFYPKPVKNH